MATATINVLLHGVSGKVGGLFVVRQRNGKAVICKLPKPYEKPPTTGQLQNRERFRKANEFAKAAILDPEKKKYYAAKTKPGQSAYNAAFKDAFHSTGQPDITVVVEKQQVTVTATQKAVRPRSRSSLVKAPVARLQKVSVALLHHSGYELEKGNAAFSEKRQAWVYSFRGKVTPQHTIRVITEDWMGNITHATFMRKQRETGTAWNIT